MIRGEWSRWGRGMCEGYSLEIGSAFRGSVVKSSTVGRPTVWIASVNMTALGEYLERREAMCRVEELAGVRKAVGIRRGAISDNMKVSFQAARSIG